MSPPASRECGVPTRRRRVRGPECADYTDCAPMDRAFLEGLRRIVGDAGVLQDPLDLLTYECDGLAHLRETPAAVVLPSSAAEVQAVVKLCARTQVPFVARGHGTGLSGGALPVAGGVVIALVAPQSRPARRHREPARHGGTRRDQPRNHASGRAVRLLLRARSLEPADLLDRRQRRRKLRRRALPQIRLHRAPRARRGGRAAGWGDRASRRHAGGHAWPGSARAARRIGRHARGRHERDGPDPPAARNGSDAAGGVRHDRRRRRRRVRHHRRRDRPGGRRDDGLARHPRRRSRGAPELPRRRHHSDRRARRPRRRGLHALRDRRRHLPAPRRDDDRGRADRRPARADLARPQGGIRGDGPRLAELLRPGRRRPADAPAGGAELASARSSRPRGFASATSFTPATATCIR